MSPSATSVACGLLFGIGPRRSEAAGGSLMRGGTNIAPWIDIFFWFRNFFDGGSVSVIQDLLTFLFQIGWFWFVPFQMDAGRQLSKDARGRQHQDQRRLNGFAQHCSAYLCVLP